MKEKKQNILIIDDEKGIRLSLQGILCDEGYSTFLAEDGAKGLEILSKESIDLIILDIWLESNPAIEKTIYNDGLVLLEHIKAIEEYKDLPIVMMSGHGTIETAVSALKYGAYDFIEKPLALDAVLNTLKRAFEVYGLKLENKSLKSFLASSQAKEDLIGNSELMKAVRASLLAVAPTQVSVLITGENGTGKEVAARAIHKASPRKEEAFIAVNCAAIPEELIESELFGHERGAFTGAEARIGKFELADKGTLFLDEIGDMSLKTQAKILRILQEQSFERIGANKTIKVSVRILAATNKDLEKAIKEGTFRSDLYYRLKGFPLHLAPLRERSEDIPLLIHSLSQTIQEQMNLSVPAFSAQSILTMQNAYWRGNVRELKNTLEQIAILYPNQEITPSMLAPLIPEMAQDENAKSLVNSNTEYNELTKLLDCGYKEAKAEFELWYLEQKLILADNNMTKLAENVGLDRSYLHRKLKPKKG